mgnify:FL=1
MNQSRTYAAFLLPVYYLYYCIYRSIRNSRVRLQLQELVIKVPVFVKFENILLAFFVDYAPFSVNELCRTGIKNN